MVRIFEGMDRYTFDMPAELRTNLDRMAADRGWSVAQCLRHIIAAHFAQLREAESDV